MRWRRACACRIAQGVLLAPRRQRARSSRTRGRDDEASAAARCERAPLRDPSPIKKGGELLFPVRRSRQIRAERPLGAGRTDRGLPRGRTDGSQGLRPHAADLPETWVCEAIRTLSPAARRRATRLLRPGGGSPSPSPAPSPCPRPGYVPWWRVPRGLRSRPPPSRCPCCCRSRHR